MVATALVAADPEAPADAVVPLRGSAPAAPHPAPVPVAVPRTRNEEIHPGASAPRSKVGIELAGSEEPDVPTALEAASSGVAGVGRGVEVLAEAVAA